MGKTYCANGTVVQVKPSGEKNFMVVAITKETGLLNATLYGGPKSRLKSLVSPWNSGIFYLTEGQNGQFPKLNDFDVKKYHESFRADLFKMWAASLAAEIAIKTKCADNNEECLKIFQGFIDGLELCKTKEKGQAGLIRFLWRYLQILGMQPDVSLCSQCQASFLGRNLSQDNVKYIPGGANYIPQENSFVCTDCSKAKTSLYLGIDAIQYLAAVSALKPSESRTFPLSQEGAGQLKELVFYLSQNACGSSLKSLESGIGIL